MSSNRLQERLEECESYHVVAGDVQAHVADDGTTLVFDVIACRQESRAIDPLHLLLQLGARVSDITFRRVSLRSAGNEVYVLGARDFEELSSQYAQDARVWAFNNWPERLRTPDGQKHFETWTGGMIGVLAGQTKDLASALQTWLTGAALQPSDDDAAALSLQQPPAAPSPGLVGAASQPGTIHVSLQNLEITGDDDIAYLNGKLVAQNHSPFDFHNFRLSVELNQDDMQVAQLFETTDWLRAGATRAWPIKNLSLELPSLNGWQARFEYGNATHNNAPIRPTALRIELGEMTSGPSEPPAATSAVTPGKETIEVPGEIRVRFQVSSYVGGLAAEMLGSYSAWRISGLLSVENASQYDFSSFGLSVEMLRSDTKVGDMYETTDLLPAGQTRRWRFTDHIVDDPHYDQVQVRYDASASLNGVHVGNPKVHLKLLDVDSRPDATELAAAGASGSTCYVVTACSRDPSHPLVERYRRFRAERLSRSTVGRGAISAYEVVGPYLARGIASNEPLRALSFRLLLCVARLLPN